MDHFKETRSTSVLVSPRSRARRRLLRIIGKSIPGGRRLRDQLRSRLNGLRGVVTCFLIKVSAFKHASSLQELAAMARTKERDDVSSAAAAYDTQEQDLITKTRKIIAASNRALREAEAVLKRR